VFLREKGKLHNNLGEGGGALDGGGGHGSLNDGGRSIARSFKWEVKAETHLLQFQLGP